MATLIDRRGTAAAAHDGRSPAAGPAPPAALDRRATAGEIARCALAASVIRLLACDARLRLHPDPDAIHDARVAVRRIRSELRALGRIFERAWAAALRARLKRLGRVLGEARDADVLSTRLARDLRKLAEPDRARAAAVLVLLHDAGDDAYARLGAMVRGYEYVATIDALVDAAEDPVFGERAGERARDVVRAVMKRGWRELRRAVRERSRPPTDGELHRIRIAAKRVRYAAEALAPVAGKRARRFAARVARLQDALGEQHDAVLASARLRGLTSTVDAAFAAGELAALERLADLRARRAWRKTWRAMSRRKERFWR